jgi:transposase
MIHRDRPRVIISAGWALLFGKFGSWLHFLFDPGGQSPTWFDITPARLHDSRLCEGFALTAGATYVFDRTYNKAEFYKRRWQIELFFKWINQNLKIKRFLAKNSKAIRLQIVTAR